ncbi:MAG TPA: DMT family transporter [Crinalium sp.]|jgi:drug/metabolite transporter (DMT)-like permease
MTSSPLRGAKNPLAGLLCALLAVLFWATIGTVFKLSVLHLASFTTTVYVSFLATCALGINLIIQKKLMVLRQEWKKQRSLFLIAGVIGLGIQQVCYLTGYQLLPASQVVSLFYLYPLLMTLLSALWFREPLSAKAVLLLITGCAGVYFLMAKDQLLNVEPNIGIVATLIAAIAWAFFSVLIQHKQFDPDVGMFLFNGFGLLFLIGLIPAFGLTWPLTSTEWTGVLYLAIFPTAIAFLLWNQALHLSSTTTCSAIALLTPLLSVVLNITILHESILLTQWVGFALLLGSVLLNFLSDRTILAALLLTDARPDLECNPVHRFHSQVPLANDWANPEK